MDARRMVPAVVCYLHTTDRTSNGLSEIQLSCPACKYTVRSAA